MIIKNILLLTFTINFFILFQHFTFFNNKIDIFLGLRRCVLLFNRIVITPWNQECTGTMQYLNTCSKEIYPFICYYKRENVVCSKYFFVQSTLPFFANCLLKNCYNNKSKLLFRFGQGKWIGEEVCIVPKRFKCSFAWTLSKQE